MAWLSVDKNGDEIIWTSKPERSDRCGGEWVANEHCFSWFFLPKGSIKKLIGRELSWSSEPVELV